MSIQILLFLFIYIIYYLDPSIGQSCESKQTCEDCIKEFGCEWCIDLVDPKEIIHCRSENETDWCATPMNLKYDRETVIDDQPFSNDTRHPIQVKPQRVKIQLRKEEKYELKFQYKSTENFPVDLYYLMDLSSSMKEYKATLAVLGERLAETMRNLTTNFQLGFGGFIDKVDLPFVSTVPQRLKNPCNASEKCSAPYTFKNFLTLTTDSQEFVRRVSAAEISGNMDFPEGGFDGLMQAMVCEEKIGWRKGARHLLVFSTDAEYHIAGDGKLGGVIEPNRAICYESNDEYLIYDYPSVSQINHVAQQKKINIIFAIVVVEKRGLRNTYKALSDVIENSKFGELEKDESKVIKLVVDNYDRITQNVKFTSNATKEVDVKFSSTCDGSIDGMCKNVHVSDILEFTAHIEPRECTNEGTKYISLFPEALDQSVVIELEVLCDCPCSTDQAAIVRDSDRCNRQGDLRCGTCDCKPGKHGSQCECDIDSPFGESQQNVSNCIFKSTGEVCSDRGECLCGKCKCKPDFTGRWCECDENSCKKDGVICSKKGVCECNTCSCEAGYSGPKCECKESVKSCIAPDSDQICSNHGKCVCGRCHCTKDANSNRYSGQFCNECTSCPAQRCQELQDCVECQAYSTGKFNETRCKEECSLNLVKVLNLTQKTDVNVKKCQQPDNDQRCTIHFEYEYDEKQQTFIRTLNEKVCPAPPNVLAWVFGVVGSILISGIVMLLVWKVYTTIHDRREYAKFEKERNALRWHRNDNPLYRGATSTFANPVYNRSSSRLSFRK